MTGFIILVISTILFGIAFFVFFVTTLSSDSPIGSFIASTVCLICCISCMILSLDAWNNKPDCIKKRYDNHIKKVDYATKELQKFLIDHPEFKMEEK